MVINRHTGPCLVGQVHYAGVLIDDLMVNQLEMLLEKALSAHTYVFTFAMEVFAVS